MRLSPLFKESKPLQLKNWATSCHAHFHSLCSVSTQRHCPDYRGTVNNLLFVEPLLLTNNFVSVSEPVHMFLRLELLRRIVLKFHKETRLQRQASFEEIKS
jgi:hypothetical protein